jgi:hypothetical protein
MPFNELPNYLSSDVSPIFIGGDTQNFFFDFGLKKSNSILECPLKIYEQDVYPDFMPNPATGWTEVTSQYELDMLKFNDGNIVIRKTSVNGTAKAFLIEIDLTNLCNALYGVGRSDLLKNSLININLEAWASTCSMFIWNDTFWNNFTLSGGAMENFTSDIERLLSIQGMESITEMISTVGTNNKIYITLVSTTTASVTLDSEIGLDYAQVKITLERIKDVIMNPPKINVPRKFAIIMKGIAPAWDSSNSLYKGLFTLYKDVSNSIELYTKSGKFSVKSNTSNYDLLNGVVNDMFQNINLIFEQQDSGAKRLRVLPNHGILSQYNVFSDTTSLTGESDLYPLYYKTGDKQGDSFIESLQFLPDVNFENDTEAENILRGLAPGYQNPELVNNYNFEAYEQGWTCHPDIKVINNKLILYAEDKVLFKDNYQKIAVYPNNLYQIVTQASDDALTRLEFYYNDIKMSYSKAMYGYAEKFFITPQWCNNVRIVLTNYKPGTFSWDSISIKRFDAIAPEHWKTNDFYIDMDYNSDTAECLKVERSGTVLSNPFNNYNYVSGTKLADNNKFVRNNNAIFVGGDTQSYYYDLKLKDVDDITYPVKLYEGLSDTNHVPEPGDTIAWKEVLYQKAIDEVKTQNAVTYTIDTAAKTAVWNGQNLKVDSIVVTDDFVNKTPASIDENPNTIRLAINTLQTPVGSWGRECNSSEYGCLNSVNNQNVTVTALLNNEVPQLLISFNLIRIFEDKYGLIPIDRTGTPADILARQVAWLKRNISKIKSLNYTYGICPTGNKAYLQEWTGTVWAGSLNNISNTPTSLSMDLTLTNSNSIDDNGVVYFIIYADSAQTTNPNFIVMENHELTTNDIIENSSKNNQASTISKIMPDTNVIVLDTPVTDQLPGDTINKYIYNSDKISETGTTENSVVINNHGLTTGDYIKNVRLNTVRKIKVIDANTFNFEMPEVNPITGQVAGDTFKLYNYTTNQTADATVIPSTVYLDYASVELHLKAPTGYDLLVPENPRRDSGLGCILLLNQTDDKHSYFITPNCLQFATTTSDKYSTILIEIDMKDINDSVKTINIDSYIGGYGIVESVLTNGANIMVWEPTMSAWGSVGSDSNFIVKTSVSVGDVISDTNKIYIAVVSKSPSDSNVPSSVSLDDIRISVNLQRNKDIITNQHHFNLPERWALFIKNINIAWDKNEFNGEKVIFNIFKDNDNKVSLRYNGDKWQVVFRKNGLYEYIDLNDFEVKKGQTFSMLFELIDTGKIYVLANGGQIIWFDNPNMKGLAVEELVELAVLGSSSETLKSDSYYEKFKFFDFTKHAEWTNGIPDATVANMLSGAETGYENEELLPPFNKWILNPFAFIQNDIVVLNATEAKQESYTNVDVFPNNNYKFIASAGDNAQIKFVQSRYGKILSEKVYTKDADDTIYIDKNCLECKVVLTNSDAGKYEYYSTSLKLL